VKTIYCQTITTGALALIRKYEGDVRSFEAILCHYTREEPSRNKYGNLVEDAYKVTYPNGEAICYNLGGAISLA